MRNLAWIRPRWYFYIGRKYWRKNRLKHWWILHVWDEVLIDWEHRNGRCSRDGCSWCPRGEK